MQLFPVTGLQFSVSDSSLSSSSSEDIIVYKSTPRLGQILTTSPEDYNPEDNFSVAMKLLEKVVARPHAKRSRGMESRSFKYLR